MDNNKKLELRVVSSLAKVFADEISGAYMPKLTALGGEHLSFQVAFHFQAVFCQYAKVKIESSLPISFRQVALMPVSYPCRTGWYDADYIRTTEGLYPDLLQEAEGNVIRLIEDQWRSIWVEAVIPYGCTAGEYPVSISITEMDGTLLGTVKTSIHVIGADLPKQTLKRTEWFYGDCLADYYGIEALSEQHWKVMEAFIKKAVDRGCNMILTPIFTPPLDTEVGMERTTVQLVDVEKTESGYQFGFENLRRWVHMCKACGIQFFEMAHMFTQWGATAAPKIVATVDGQKKRIFGWDTPADGEEYRTFLKLFLQELTRELRELGIAEETYFHISDEPREDHLAQYQRNKEWVAPLLEGFHILDALSDVSFYEQGIVEEPVCASDCIDPFLEKRHGKIWSYYCISQAFKVANRFVSMPSSRNRIYGYQVFKFQMEGTLHWGYNFYNAERSVKRINPYQTLDGDGSFPAGDSFLVYPGKNGEPEESIRMMVMAEAMEDVRAFELLEQLTDHETVVNLVEEGLEEPITFSNYPKGEQFCLEMRQKVNKKIEELLAKRQGE